MHVEDDDNIAEEHALHVMDYKICIWAVRCEHHHVFNK